jgi:hypothetical protein
MLIKKTPFSPAERTRILDYFRKHQTDPVYPGDVWAKANKHPMNYFARYTADFRNRSVWVGLCITGHRIAQFSGFTVVLFLAAGIYGLALLCYQRLDATMT